MDKAKRTIIVTGSNKGIGFGLVELLSKEGIWHIIMACRNLKLAQQARNTLLSKTPDASIQLAELDVSSLQSIDKFVLWLKKQNRKVDVIVNNAAVLIREWTIEALDQCFQTNFYGTVYLTEQILPLIIDEGKIISVSSTRAQYPNVLVSQELKNKWSDPTLTKQTLLQLVEQYKASVKQNTTEEIGYLVNKERFYFYPATKLALSTFVKMFSKRTDVVERKIQVYNLHPGYINTDMSLHKGTGTVEEGIDTLKYLIDLPFVWKEELQGELFENRKVISLDPPVEASL